MNPRSFFTGLVITSFIQVILCAMLLWLMSAVRAHLGFMITSIATMMLFCILMYGAARVLARSKLTRLYIQLIMIAVFLKMLLCLALIIGYKNGFTPTDNSFIWPFLCIYLTSTIYEVIFLEKVGREKHTPAA